MPSPWDRDGGRVGRLVVGGLEKRSQIKGLPDKAQSHCWSVQASVRMLVACQRARTANGSHVPGIPEGTEPAAFVLDGVTRRRDQRLFSTSHASTATTNGPHK